MVTLDPAKQQQICYEAQRLMNQVGPFAGWLEANIQVGYREGRHPVAGDQPCLLS